MLSPKERKKEKKNGAMRSFIFVFRDNLKETQKNTKRKANEKRTHRKGTEWVHEIVH